MSAFDSPFISCTSGPPRASEEGRFRGLMRATYLSVTLALGAAACSGGSPAGTSTTGSSLATTGFGFGALATTLGSSGSSGTTGSTSRTGTSTGSAGTPSSSSAASGTISGATTSTVFTLSASAATSTTAANTSSGARSVSSTGSTGSAGSTGAQCSSSCPAGYALSAQGVCAASGQPPVALDIEAFDVSGRVTLNGKPPKDLCTPTVGSLQFTDGAQQFTAQLASDFSWDVSLPAGTWQVTLTADSNCSNLPSGTVASQAITVSQSSSGQVVDVSAFSVTGSVTLNGVPPKDLCTPFVGDVYFDDGVQAFTTELTSDFTWGLSLPAGTYQVTVDADSNCSNLPPGSLAASPITVSAAQAVTEDFQAFDVSGVVTLNGSHPKDLCTPTVGQVTLTDGTQSFSTALSSNFTWDVSVPAGTYQVTVTADENCSSLPPATLPGPTITVSSALSQVPVNIDAVAVSGLVTLGGAKPKDLCTPTVGTVDFSDGTNDFATELDANFTWSLSLPTGTYQVSVSADPGCSNLPAGSVPLPAMAVTSDMSGLDLNLVPGQAFQLSGTVTLNGAMPHDLCTPTVGSVDFSDGTQDFTAEVDSSFRWSVALPGGTYAVTVTGDSSCSNLPPGSVAVQPLTVSAPQTGIPLNIQASDVSGSVTLNGGPPDVLCTPTAGTVYFQDGSQSFATPLNSNNKWDLWLPTGDYEVSVDATSGCSNLPPGSLVVVCALQVP